LFAGLLRCGAKRLDSPAAHGLHHDKAGSGRIAVQNRSDVPALPRREKMRLYRMLAGRAWRVRDMQGNRTSHAVGAMNVGGF